MHSFSSLKPTGLAECDNLVHARANQPISRRGIHYPVKLVGRWTDPTNLTDIINAPLDHLTGKSHLSRSPVPRWEPGALRIGTEWARYQGAAAKTRLHKVPSDYYVASSSSEFADRMCPNLGRYILVLETATSMRSRARYASMDGPV
jgi:hypothetical protein